MNKHNKASSKDEGDNPKNLFSKFLKKFLPSSDLIKPTEDSEDKVSITFTVECTPSAFR